MEDDAIHYSVGYEGEMSFAQEYGGEFVQVDWGPLEEEPCPPPTNDDLLYAKTVLGAGAAILEKKQRDYSPGEDIFTNFREVGAELERLYAKGIPSPYLAFFFNIKQKQLRLEALIGTSQEPENESLFDTCMDVANYYALLAAFIRKERR
jgi:hypothetical protein